MKLRIVGMISFLTGFSFLITGCPGKSSNPTTLPAATDTPTKTVTTTLTSTSVLTNTLTLTHTVTPTPTITLTPTNVPPILVPTRADNHSPTLTVTDIPVFTQTPFPTTVTPVPYLLSAWTGPVTLAQSGSTGGINGDFGSPTGVAVGAGFIAVSDSAFENIQVFNSTGGYLYSIPSLGGSPNLWDVAIDAYGELYCADLGNGAVDGYYLGQTGATYDYTWSGQGVLSGPGGVRIDANGNLVVADFYNAVVYNLNWADDTVLNQTGTTYLSKPFGVALDPAGNIYVADGAKQIVEYGSGYNYVNSFTGSGWTTPLGESCGVGVDSQGNLFISDYTNARVVYATTQGKYLGELDGFGGPDHLVLDNADDLFVADYYYYAVDEYTK